MTKILIFLLISIKAFSQVPTPYDRVYQDPKIRQGGLDILQLQGQSAVYSDRTLKLIADSVWQASQIKTLQNQSAVYSIRTNALIIDSTEDGKQIRLLQAFVANLSKRMLAQEADSTAKGKQIRAMQVQITVLQKFNTLEGKGSINIKKEGATTNYKISNDTATKVLQGNLSVYYRKLIDDLVKTNIDLKTRITALERFNNSMHGNTQALGGAINLPGKTKKVIINTKE